uniref:Uncharacterized protein n=1 Tax=Pyrodinium bahamense TaxID=73915 RepID=A0A7S0AB53_9DINO
MGARRRAARCRLPPRSSRRCGWPRGCVPQTALLLVASGGVLWMGRYQALAALQVFVLPARRTLPAAFPPLRGCRMPLAVRRLAGPYGGPGWRQPGPPQPGFPEDVPDPMALMRQMLSGEAPPGSRGMPGGFPNMPGGMPAGFSARGLLFGAFKDFLLGRQARPTTDSFITNRVPVLQTVKRPIMIAFFAYCLYNGWVGRFGFLQGALGSSYFDMLAVPLRVLPTSPLYGLAYFYAQMWLDLGLKAMGFLINLARGKAKIPSPKAFMQQIEDMAQQPGGARNPWAGAAGGAEPWGQATSGAASPFAQPSSGSPWDALVTPPHAQPAGMPTAPTTPLQVPPLQTHPLQAQPPSAPVPAAKPVASRRPSSKPPPVIDADVTFLD